MWKNIRQMRKSCGENVLAKEVINRLGIENPPVPVVRVAKKMGVTVLERPNADFDSAFQIDGDKASIWVKKSFKKPHRRYLTAYELGYLLRSDDMVHRSCDVLSGVGGCDMLSKEWLAHRFASTLLMPEGMVMFAVSYMYLNIDAISNTFGVPEVVATDRLCSLGYKDNVMTF